MVDGMGASRQDLVAFGRALAAELHRMARSEFAHRVAEVSGESVSEAAVSLWLLGRSEPSRQKVFAMEQVLEVRPGTLSRLLGYLPVGARTLATADEAIRADPNLSRTAKRVLLAAYREARRSETRTR